MNAVLASRLGAIRLRTAILASLGAPLLLLWIAGYYTWSSWRDHRYAELTIEANRQADLVIRAAGKLALERGTTVAALTAPPERRPALTAQVAQRRGEAEAIRAQALEITRRLIAANFAGPALDSALRQAETSHAALQAARTQVDRSLAGAAGITPEAWIRVISAHIADAARVRMAAFSGESLPAAAAFDSLTTKHQAWLASEYAGLERGTLVGLINARQPLPAETLHKLRAYQQTMRGAVQELLFLRQVPGVGAGVIAAVDAMEKRLAEFETLRARVYATAGTGDFPVSGEEWFAGATAAIDGILAVSDALSAASIDKAADFSAWRRTQAVGYAATFLAMLVVTALTALLLLAKLRGIDRLRRSMAELAEGDGDLTRRLPADAQDEVGATSAAFNRFVEHLQNIVRQVLAGVAEVSAAAERLAASAQAIQNSSGQQRQATVSAAAAVEVVRTSLESVAENARETSRTAEEATQLAGQGVDTMLAASREVERMAALLGDTARGMDSLNQDAEKISGILGLIHEIAGQTNLLALNAAIEAARAGEQGRGFAVVADEVRKLAERTGKATTEIGAMIAALQESSRRAAAETDAAGNQAGATVDTIRQAAGLLQRIDASVREAHARTGEIAAATRAQRDAGGEISRHVDHIAAMAADNEASVAENAAGAQRLRELAGGLQNLVGRFRS